MSREQIVGKHADRAAGELGTRGELELNLDPDLGREDVAEHVQRTVVTELVKVAVAVKKDVKLQVVVGKVFALRSGEDAAFATPIAAAEENGIKLGTREEPAKRTTYPLT